jgi:hypothetical protein
MMSPSKFNYESPIKSHRLTRRLYTIPNRVKKIGLNGVVKDTIGKLVVCQSLNDG